MSLAATPGQAQEALRSLASPAVLRRTILFSCAAFSAVALLSAAHWLATGESRWLDFWFKEIGGPLLAVFAVAEAAGAAAAASWFSPGEPMGKVWRLLAAAGAVHAVSMVLRHILGMQIGANPLHSFGGGFQATALLRDFGHVLGGTLYFALLAAGLTLALREHWKLRLIRSLSRSELAVLLAAGGVFAYTLLAARFWLSQPEVRPNPLWWIGWLTDPLLALLFSLSLLLGKSAGRLQGGLLGRPWLAYFSASLLTCIGSLFVGLSEAGLVRGEALWPVWLLWHPAAAAFALAPVYQLEAVRYAIRHAAALAGSGGSRASGR